MDDHMKYSLTEIDEMRAILRERMAPSGSHSGREFSASVEDALRTLMANGTPLCELQDDIRKRRALRAEIERLAVVTSRGRKACMVCGTEITDATYNAYWTDGRAVNFTLPCGAHRVAFPNGGTDFCKKGGAQWEGAAPT